MPGLNVHIYPSPFINESRMLKITRSLIQARVFDGIRVMATWEPGLPEREMLDEGREVVRIRRTWGEGRRGAFWKIVRTLEWSWRILNALKTADIACINCHSLAVLPLGAWLKRRHGGRLVYDTHELETETTTMRGPVRWMAKGTERLLITQVDELIAVNRSIAEWYARHYPGLRVSVVRNVPVTEGAEVEPSMDIKAKLGVPSDAILFVYQGVLAGGRGIELLLRMFARAPDDRHILFLGFGSLQAAVEAAAARHPNIHFHPAVEPGRVRGLTAGADVGIHLIENTCLNHYYCLPNKVWEYLSAGLPMVVSDFPEMAAVVEQFACGWTSATEEEAALHLIRELTPALIGEKRLNAARARGRFGWHLEEPALLEPYRRMGFLP